MSDSRLDRLRECTLVHCYLMKRMDPFGGDLCVSVAVHDQDGVQPNHILNKNGFGKHSPANRHQQTPYERRTAFCLWFNLRLVKLHASAIYARPGHVNKLNPAAWLSFGNENILNLTLQRQRKPAVCQMPASG